MTRYLPSDEEDALVDAIRGYEKQSAEANTDDTIGYWRGVAYGIQHAVRMLFGTRAGDRLVQLKIDADRAEAMQVPS